MEVTQPHTTIKIRPFVKKLLGEGRHTLPPTREGLPILIKLADRSGEATLPLLMQSFTPVTVGRSSLGKLVCFLDRTNIIRELKPVMTVHLISLLPLF
jgi:hypothetical protein